MGTGLRLRLVTLKLFKMESSGPRWGIGIEECFGHGKKEDGTDDNLVLKPADSEDSRKITLVSRTVMERRKINNLEVSFNLWSA